MKHTGAGLLWRNCGIIRLAVGAGGKTDPFEPQRTFLNSLPILPIDFQIDQYAASIVEKYRIIPDTSSASHHAADKVIPVLKQWAKQYLHGITLSGAYAKNTAISLSSHIDLLVALTPIPGMDVKTIYWNLFKYPSDQDVHPHTRDVSIRLQIGGISLDLIPACREPKTSGNELFNKRSGQAVHTDVARHVHLIANSGRQQEICALKIWRERMSLDFPSLYLELIVLRALGSERFGQLADNILAMFSHLSSEI